jgi:hypothetical protein
VEFSDKHSFTLHPSLDLYGQNHKQRNTSILVGLATLTGSSRVILVGLATLTGSFRLILVGLATLMGSSRLNLVGLATLTGSSRSMSCSSPSGSSYFFGPPYNRLTWIFTKFLIFRNWVVNRGQMYSIVFDCYPPFCFAPFSSKVYGRSVQTHCFFGTRLWWPAWLPSPISKRIEKKHLFLSSTHPFPQKI